MTAFMPGDRVLVPATVVGYSPFSGRVRVRFESSVETWFAESDLSPAPVDPELVPGMVVAPLDPKTPGSWWVAERYDGTLLFCGAPALNTYFRRELPAKIRVVLDPREVTT